MATDMGMTNKQFQGFIRLALEFINNALMKTPDNEDLQKLKDSSPEWRDYDQKDIDSNYVKCALLAKLFHDENGMKKAIAKLSHK